MHPIVHDELSKSRIADLHRKAERDRLAWAFRQARRTHGKQRNDPAGGRAAGVIARRLLIIMGARSA